MSDSAPAVKKRFIAGAKCPQCQSIDTLRCYKLDGQDFRECVACDFHEAMHFQPGQRELTTRVNQSAEVKAAEVSAVKILEPSPVKPDAS